MKSTLIGLRYIDSLEMTVWHKSFKHKKAAKKWLIKTFNNKKYDDIILVFAFMDVGKDRIIDLLK